MSQFRDTCLRGKYLDSEAKGPYVYPQGAGSPAPERGTQVKRSAFVLVLVALVAPVLALLSGTAAQAAPIFKNASISILHNAALTTGGVNVTVRYKCAPASPTDTGGFLAVVVTQGTTEGNGTASTTCDGGGHQATVLVTALSGTYVPGAANASAGVSNGNGSASAQQLASIAITG